MTNDGHNGDNVEQGRAEPTLKEVCITPQPNRNASYTTCLGPKGCLWALLGSLGPHGVLFNFPCRGRSDSASAGRVPAEAQFTTDKCVDGSFRLFFFAVLKMWYICPSK